MFLVNQRGWWGRGANTLRSNICIRYVFKDNMIMLTKSNHFLSHWDLPLQVSYKDQCNSSCMYTNNCISYTNPFIVSVCEA